ncbi:MAG: signal recognition particle-docking protein FtsY [Actinobacteria bacterium]|nr:signal recognition particle-docking protein FtsY [Actinomycetota bacterium]
MALFSFSGVTSLISKLRREPGVNADVDWNEIEQQLINSDLGPKLSVELVNLLKKNSKVSLEDGLLELLGKDRDRNLIRNQTPNVILIVGVNGVGKTTTVGKLAHYLVATGNKVVIGAADTFRAAATGQVSTWAVNAGATLVSGKDGADPAAIAFDAVAKGFEIGADFVLIDTAGRLHTKAGLMDELSKIRRVIEKRTSVGEVLLVIDGTTGQNGLAQAQIFAQAVGVTGVVVTKLDGSAKGGIAFAIERELGAPIKFVGTGEGISDLAPFAAAAFVAALISS